MPTSAGLLDQGCLNCVSTSSTRRTYGLQSGVEPDGAERGNGHVGTGRRLAVHGHLPRGGPRTGAAPNRAVGDLVGERRRRTPGAVRDRRVVLPVAALAPPRRRQRGVVHIRRFGTSPAPGEPPSSSASAAVSIGVAGDVADCLGVPVVLDGRHQLLPGGLRRPAGLFGTRPGPLKVLDHDPAVAGRAAGGQGEYRQECADRSPPSHGTVVRYAVIEPSSFGPLSRDWRRPAGSGRRRGRSSRSGARRRGRARCRRGSTRGTAAGRASPGWSGTTPGRRRPAGGRVRRRGRCGPAGGTGRSPLRRARLWYPSRSGARRGGRRRRSGRTGAALR